MPCFRPSTTVVDIDVSLIITDPYPGPSKGDLEPSVSSVVEMDGKSERVWYSNFDEV